MSSIHSDFPSDETLAAFIDGRLDPKTRSSVIEHMASCDECYAVFQSVSELGAAAIPSERPPATTPRFGWNAAAGLVALASAAALLFVFWQPIRARFDGTDRGIPALVVAAEPLTHRGVEPRLSGAFTYKPARGAMRGSGGSDPVTDPEKWPLLSAAAKIQERTKADPTAANLHALGVAHLLLGNNAEAVSALEAALRLATKKDSIPAAIESSTDASLLVDLSAANYASGQSRSMPGPLAVALAASTRATTIAPKNAAAWYGHALNLEALRRPAEAARAWQHYITLDASSPWANEARAHLDSLR